jgi:hypothetical protein
MVRTGWGVKKLIPSPGIETSLSGEPHLNHRSRHWHFPLSIAVVLKTRLDVKMPIKSGIEAHSRRTNLEVYD